MGRQVSPLVPKLYCNLTLKLSQPDPGQPPSYIVTVLFKEDAVGCGADLKAEPV